MSESIHDLVGVYALDAVDDLERHRFETHLATCARCRSELELMRSTLEGLSLDTAQVPPPGLRSKVLAAFAEHVAQETGADERAPARGRTGDRVHRPAAARRRGISRRALLAAGATAAIAGVGTVTVRQLREPQSVDPAEQILADDQARRSTATYRGSQVTVAWTSDGLGAVRFDPVPQSIAGKAYTMWLINGAGGTANAGALTTSQMSHRSSVSMQLRGDLRQAKTFGVTLEPSGTTPQAPTSPPLFVVELV